MGIRWPGPALIFRWRQWYQLASQLIENEACTTIQACLKGLKLHSSPQVRSGSVLQLSWREAHNKMLMRHLIALENLKKTQPPIEKDKILALLYVPFTGTSLFGEELAKLQEAYCVPANSAPCLLFLSAVCRLRKKF